MSDQPQGPGWWQASDYKWYPPQPPTLPAPPMASDMPAPQGPPAFQGAPPYGQPVFPGPSGPAVKKKSNLPVILGVIFVVLLLGVGGCVAVLVTAADEVADEARENEATPIFPGEDNTSAPAGGGGSAGTREEPLPIGSEVDLGNGWRVKVLSADIGPSAGEAVAAANQFNEPPKDGMRYIVVNLSATFAGRTDVSTETPFFGFEYSAFGSANVERDGFGAMAVAPAPELDTLSELAAGGEASGNVVLTVGADETDLVLRLQPSLTFDATESWIALG